MTTMPTNMPVPVSEASDSGFGEAARQAVVSVREFCKRETGEDCFVCLSVELTAHSTGRWHFEVSLSAHLPTPPVDRRRSRPIVSWNGQDLAIAVDMVCQRVHETWAKCKKPAKQPAGAH